MKFQSATNGSTNQNGLAFVASLFAIKRRFTCNQKLASHWPAISPTSPKDLSNCGHEILSLMANWPYRLAAHFLSMNCNCGCIPPPAVCTNLPQRIQRSSSSSICLGKIDRSTERTGEWEPVNSKIVVEVAYDHFTGGRFRHGTKILRWRSDKAPLQCTLDQVANREGKSLALL